MAAGINVRGDLDSSFQIEEFQGHKLCGNKWREGELILFIRHELEHKHLDEVIFFTC